MSRVDIYQLFHILRQVRITYLLGFVNKVSWKRHPCHLVEKDAFCVILQKEQVIHCILYTKQRVITIISKHIHLYPWHHNRK